MDKRVPLEKFNIKTSFSPMEDMGFFVNHEHHPFDAFEDKFSATNAWWMADHSRLAYVKDQEHVILELADAGFEDVEFIWDKKSGTKVYVTWNNVYTVISFTGTEPENGASDYLTDLNLIPKKSGQGGVVHSGFKKAFETVWDKVNDILHRPDVPSTVWITGHSLGGALATLAASRIAARGCYTFGSPRVGSKSFNKTIETSIYRVAKNNDIVTRVPTPPVYIHNGDMYFVTDDQRVLENPRWITMFRERLGGNELAMLLLLIKIVVLRSPIDFILSYFHGHSPYNYSVFMWNNIEKFIVRTRKT